jgi:CheY-like chemotaxis protein
MSDHQKTILVADDRAPSRELIRSVLESCGYRVIEAADGLETLQKANEFMPDLLLLDLQMPNMDGFGVVAQLRQDARFASRPIVALTASAMQGDRERAIAAGFSVYIAKPIGIVALREEVARLLR